MPVCFQRSLGGDLQPQPHLSWKNKRQEGLWSDVAGGGGGGDWWQNRFGIMNTGAQGQGMQDEVSITGFKARNFHSDGRLCYCLYWEENYP